MNVGLLKTTLVNFPGRVATAVFLPGCNLRCPFCYNAELALASSVTGPENCTDDHDYVDIHEFYKHMEKRKDVISGIAISGGEPLLSAELIPLIKKAKHLQLAVKIDTNGTLPDRLLQILSDQSTCPDMISIDIKTSLHRYGELASESSAGPKIAEALKKSLKILQEYAATVKIEYRTVLVPGLINEEELGNIADLLPWNADWQLSHFIPEGCLDPSYTEQTAYGPEKIKRLHAFARSRISNTQLR